MLGVLYFVCGICFFRVISSEVIYPKGGNYESEFLHNLTRQMIAKNQIETLATYGVNRELQRRPTIVAKSLEQSLTEEFEMPIVTWGLRRNVSLRRILGYNTLVYVSISSVLVSEEPIFDVLSDGLAGQHYVPMLFIYKRLKNGRPPSRKELKIFFTWCWRYRFTHVVLTFWRIKLTNIDGFVVAKGHHELFSYTPFPELTLLNLTEKGYQHLDILMDLRGYEFRVPIFQDPPVVFLLPNGDITGGPGLMMSAYVRHRGGRLRLEPVTGVDRYNYPEHLMLAAARGEIEIGVHPYLQMHPGSALTAGSFPLGATNACVLVPWQRELPSAQFMRRTIHINGCFFLILLLATTLAWHLVCSDGGQGIRLSLVAFFQQSLPGRQFQRLADSFKYIHMAVIMASFVLWALRTGNLSSVYTSQSPGPQIETAKDFLATPLRLMLTEMEMQMYFTAGRLPSALKPRLLVVNRTTLMEHLERLNTSYAYCTTEEHWSVVQLQQRRMHRPHFRLASKLCTANQMVRLPMQWNSPFERNFYKFGMESRQFGFWDHWWSRGLREAVSIGLVVQLTDDNQPFISLQLEDFESLLKLCSFFLLGSFACLMGEIVCFYYRANRAWPGNV